MLEVSHMSSHIRHLLSHQRLQERHHLLQLSVLRIRVPSLYSNSVVRLALEILFHVIDDDAFRQISSKSAQVLQVSSMSEPA